MDGMRDLNNEVYTVTFGDVGENQPGMQMFGKPAERGMSVEHLECIASQLEVMDRKASKKQLATQPAISFETAQKRKRDAPYEEEA